MASVTATSASASVRETGKAERRERILGAARNILRESGHEALSIRSLAGRAGVTTPTIYNLIGHKQDVLLALASETIERLEQAHHISTTVDPIEKAEEVINDVIAIYREDEAYSRELQLGLEAASLEDFEGNLRGRGREVAIEDCARAAALGYLNGEIDSALLGHRFATGFQQAQREWLRGQRDLEGMRKEALITCFIVLAADANPEFRRRLFERIQELRPSG